MAGQYVANMRQAILKELKAAYHKIEIIEEFSYGKYSSASLARNLNWAQRGEGMEKRL